MSPVVVWRPPRGFLSWSASLDGASCCGVVSGASATGAGTVSTFGSIGGCSRPAADVADASVRGRSTLSCPAVRSSAAAGRGRLLRGPPGRAPERLPPPGPPGPRRRLTGPSPSRSWLRSGRTRVTRRAPRARRRGDGRCPARRGACLRLRGVALGHDLALVDPDLDADPAERRLRLDEAVVDVRADRVQRDAALGIGLRAAHLRAAEPAAAGDLDPLRTGTDRRRERALHRAPERHAVLQLLGDRLRDELRVELGPLDLVDVDVDVLAGDGVQLLAKRIDLDTGLADHDPRARRVDVDRHRCLSLRIRMSERPACESFL